MIPTKEVFWEAQPGMSSFLPGSSGRVTLDSCLSLGLLWTDLALEEPSAVIFFWSGLLQLATAISLLRICRPRWLEGDVTSLSKRKLQEEDKHMTSFRALLLACPTK